MAVDQRRRQKQLAKKAAKRKAAVAAKKSTGGGSSALLSKDASFAARCPIYECLISKELFDVGLGYALISRKFPTGMIAISLFLVDVHCLGVKDAMFNVADPEEYAVRVGKLAGSQPLEPVEPSCVRKVVEGAVAFAEGLGLAPHKDYEVASRIFGEIDPGSCPETYQFGKDGKPHYVPGPFDSPVKSRKIMDILSERLGPDGFHFMVGSEL